MTIPTLITLIRILAIPVLVVVFYLPFSWSSVVAAGIFLLAALSDWFDGFLARNLSQTTRFGAFLDPVADKLLVSTVLVLIVGNGETAFLAVPAAIIIGREIVVSALREWMAEIGQYKKVSVKFLGKLKTTLQLVSLLLLLFAKGYPMGWTYFIGLAGLYCAAALTIWSMTIYLKAAWPEVSRSFRA